MAVQIITGLQWGDEGKGKVVDLLAENAAAVARFSGGANAGHTVETPEGRFALHLLPSGVLRKGVTVLIGAGCVVDPGALLGEIQRLQEAGIPVTDRLLISGKTHLVHPGARAAEACEESCGDQRIGTTGKGIGPTYVMKFRRRGIRMEDVSLPGLFTEKARARGEETITDLNLDPDRAGSLRNETETFIRDALALSRYVGDVSYALSRILDRGGTVIAEGAQGTLLDPDHGTYPYVTCGPCVSGAACTSLGFGPGRVGEVVGVLKAYSSRVGEGPFPTEQDNEIGDSIRERGREYGTTTGRPRRCGWLDLVAVRYAAMVSGVKEIACMLLDVLSGIDELAVCTGYRLPDGSATDRFLPDAHALQQVEPVYEVMPGWDDELVGVKRRADLPANALAYLDRVETSLGLPVRLISVGPDRTQTILR